MANGWEGWLKDAKLMGYSGQLAHQFCDSLSSILGMYVTFVYFKYFYSSLIKKLKSFC